MVYFSYDILTYKKQDIWVNLQSIILLIIRQLKPLHTKNFDLLKLISSTLLSSVSSIDFCNVT